MSDGVRQCQARLRSDDRKRDDGDDAKDAQRDRAGHSKKWVGHVQSPRLVKVKFAAAATPLTA